MDTNYRLKGYAPDTTSENTTGGGANDTTAKSNPDTTQHLLGHDLKLELGVGGLSPFTSKYNYMGFAGRLGYQHMFDNGFYINPNLTLRLFGNSDVPVKATSNGGATFIDPVTGNEITAGVPNNDDQAASFWQFGAGLALGKSFDLLNKSLHLGLGAFVDVLPVNGGYAALDDHLDGKQKIAGTSFAVGGEASAAFETQVAGHDLQLGAKGRAGYQSTSAQVPDRAADDLISRGGVHWEALVTGTIALEGKDTIDINYSSYVLFKSRLDDLLKEIGALNADNCTDPKTIAANIALLNAYKKELADYKIKLVNNEEAMADIKINETKIEDALKKLAALDAKLCPTGDNDGDGVINKDDQCPEVKGLKENNGCPDPDTDGDKIVDRLDACPNEAGVATDDPLTNGCPPKVALESKPQMLVVSKAPEACVPCTQPENLEIIKGKAAELATEIFVDPSATQPVIKPGYLKLLNEMGLNEAAMSTVRVEIKAMSDIYKSGEKPGEPTPHVVITAIHPVTGERGILMDIFSGQKADGTTDEIRPLTFETIKKWGDDNAREIKIAEAKIAAAKALTALPLNFTGGKPTADDMVKLAAATDVDELIAALKKQKIINLDVTKTLAAYDKIVAEDPTFGNADTRKKIKKDPVEFYKILFARVVELSKTLGDSFKLYLHATASTDGVQDNGKGGGNLFLSFRRAQLMSMWLNLDGLPNVGYVGTGEAVDFLASKPAGYTPGAAVADVKKSFSGEKVDENRMILPIFEAIPGGVSPTADTLKDYIEANKAALAGNIDAVRESDTLSFQTADASDAELSKLNPVDMRKRLVYGFQDIKKSLETSKVTGPESCSPTTIEIGTEFRTPEFKREDANRSITTTPVIVDPTKCDIYPEVPNPVGTQKSYDKDFKKPLAKIVGTLKSIEESFEGLPSDTSDTAWLKKETYTNNLGLILSVKDDLATMLRDVRELQRAALAEPEETFVKAELSKADYLAAIAKLVDRIKAATADDSKIKTRAELFGKKYKQFKALENKFTLRGTTAYSQLAAASGTAEIEFTGKLPVPKAKDGGLKVIKALANGGALEKPVTIRGNLVTFPYGGGTRFRIKPGQDIDGFKLVDKKSGNPFGEFKLHVRATNAETHTFVDLPTNVSDVTLDPRSPFIISLPPELLEEPKVEEPTPAAVEPKPVEKPVEAPPAATITPLVQPTPVAPVVERPAEPVAPTPAVEVTAPLPAIEATRPAVATPPTGDLTE